MTLLFYDSFDHYVDAQRTHKYTSAGAFARIGAYGRRGTNGMRANIGHSFVRAIPNSVTLITGVAYKQTTVSLTYSFIRLLDSGSIQVELKIGPNNEIQAFGGNAYRGSSANNAISVDTWAYIELKATIDNSAGSIEVYLNGVQVINLTGIDTQFTANAYANGVQMYSGLDYAYFDDFYICDTNGTIANDFLGDIKVETRMSSGAGANTDWTPSTGANYECIDDNPPNDDTDYVHTTISGDYDTYAFEDLTTISGEVFAVSVLAYARKVDAGSKFIRLASRPASTNYDGTELKSLVDSYLYYSEILEENPETATQWTISEFNASEFGVKSEG